MSDCWVQEVLLSTSVQRSLYLRTNRKQQIIFTAYNQHNNREVHNIDPVVNGNTTTRRQDYKKYPFPAYNVSAFTTHTFRKHDTHDIQVYMTNIQMHKASLNNAYRD